MSDPTISILKSQRGAGSHPFDRIDGHMRANLCQVVTVIENRPQIQSVGRIPEAFSGAPVHGSGIQNTVTCNVDSRECLSHAA